VNRNFRSSTWALPDRRFPSGCSGDRAPGCGACGDRLLRRDRTWRTGRGHRRSGGRSTFFDLALARNSPCGDRGEQNRGYIAPGEERLARLRGGETPPDLKELYTIGPFDLPDTPYFAGRLPVELAPNRWPVRPVGLARRSLLA
jgi:hypothetical protein